jgi:small-conductance mechanosensitive channel
MQETLSGLAGLTGPSADLGRWFASLLRLSVLVEAGVVLVCLALAWGLVRALRGPAPRPGSIWFGDGLFDGVLFPVAALLLALLARLALRHWVPPALMQLVVPVLLSLVAIRLTVRVLHQVFPHSGFMRAVERWVSWVAWAAAVLWITGLLPLALSELDDIQWALGSTRVSVRNLLEGLISAVLVLMVTLWVSAALEARLLQGAAGSLTTRKMAANALRALLLFVGLMVAASAAGVDLTALGVMGGALGVGIGMGLQKLAANYVSGFVILAERAVRIGDFVRVDGFEGRITDINTRYTTIRAINKREAIVPNDTLITQRVENWSRAGPATGLTTVLTVAYSSALDALGAELVAAMSAVPRVLPDPKPSVQLSNFTPDGLELTLNYSINDPEAGIANVRSDVNFAVWGALDRLGVTIPAPRRALHPPPG